MLQGSSRSRGFHRYRFVRFYGDGELNLTSGRDLDTFSGCRSPGQLYRVEDIYIGTGLSWNPEREGEEIRTVLIDRRLFSDSLGKSVCRYEYDSGLLKNRLV